MLKKIYFFIPLMLFITLPINVTASTISSTTVIPAVSNVYKEGFYTFDNLVNVDITVTLLSDTPTKITIRTEKNTISVPALFRILLKSRINHVHLLITASVGSKDYHRQNESIIDRPSERKTQFPDSFFTQQTPFF